MITKAEKSKKAIINAAREIATEKGYDGATVREISSKAGLSIGAFYHHFSSKDDVLNQSFTQFDDTMSKEKIASWDKLDSIEAIKSVLIEQTRFTESIGIFIIKEYYRSLLKEGGGGAISHERKYNKIVQRYVEKAQSEKKLTTKLSSKEITAYLIKAVRGTLVDWCLNSASYSASKRVEDECEDYLSPFRLQ